MTAILALALLCQIPVEDNPDQVASYRPPYEPRLEIELQRHVPSPIDSNAESMEFQAAQEEWVAAAGHDRTPKVIRSIIATMASRDWKVRDAGSLALEAHCRANPPDARWLYTLRRQKDPETAVRINNVIRRLSPCQQCDGKGHHSDSWSAWPCSDCMGAGIEWRRGAWD